jgi:hypothetical protein
MKISKKFLIIILPILIVAITIMSAAIAVNITEKSRNSLVLQYSSKNIHVYYTNQAPKSSSHANLIYLTEDELFNKDNPLIFRGKVEKIKNLEISFNGEKEYNAIATILVSNVYRGDIKNGDEIKILLPCPINGSVFMEDTTVVASMKEGMIGIFMPVQYDRKSKWIENGETLFQLDIASYGLNDGMRYAFLDTGEKLIFDKASYPSLKNAKTLNDIGQYIEKSIK